MTGLGRTEQEFPSRQYPHGYRSGGAGALTAPLLPGQTYRFVTGRDAGPIPLSATDPGCPQDPFATQVLLAADPPPLTLRALGLMLDRIPALSVERSFIVAEGGQIPWTPDTDKVERNFRVLVVRQGAGADQPAVLISASSDFDSDVNFLQVIGWDATAGAYQFYDRREGIWFWAGSSWDAFDDNTRGQGPFDSHINGALNMKELKAPWVHWHSQASPILDTALAPNDPLRQESLWTGKRQAEEFERTIARPGIARWTEARFARSTRQSTLDGLPAYMRQVVTTTTINLVSSPVSRGVLATATEVPLPVTFFFNADALLDKIGLEPTLTRPRVPAAVYRGILEQYVVGLTDRPTDTHFRFKGDTHFLFVVPEPALEDVSILEGLMARGILSPKLAASLLMVDFCNAIYSPRRAALLKYVPASGVIGNAAELDKAMTGAIEASPAAGQSESPERELLDNWALPDATYRRTFEARIEAFLTAVGPRLETAVAFAPIFELAESRRREFRTFKLHEFRLTTPITNVPEQAPYLEFDSQGGVRKKLQATGTIA